MKFSTKNIIFGTKIQFWTKNEILDKKNEIFDKKNKFLTKKNEILDENGKFRQKFCF